jgi:hypothetical protein
MLRQSVVLTLITNDFRGLSGDHHQLPLWTYEIAAAHRLDLGPQSCNIHVPGEVTTYVTYRPLPASSVLSLKFFDS